MVERRWAVVEGRPWPWGGREVRREDEESERVVGCGRTGGRGLARMVSEWWRTRVREEWIDGEEDEFILEAVVLLVGL